MSEESIRRNHLQSHQCSLVEHVAVISELHNETHLTCNAVFSAKVGIDRPGLRWAALGKLRLLAASQQLEPTNCNCVRQHITCHKYILHKPLTVFSPENVIKTNSICVIG